MPLRYFARHELDNDSPSRKDGVDAKKEATFRKTYVQLISEAGIKLKMPQLTIATGVVFCHRYFAVRSMHKNDRFIISIACLFLAGKVEETPRPLKDLMSVMYQMRYKNQPQFLDRLKDKQFVEDFREHVLLAERALLYTLGFEFSITHPYKYLLETIKEFSLTDYGGDKLAQLAWNFINDSWRTTLCLQYDGKQVAVAALYVTLKLLKVKGPKTDGVDWWQKAGSTNDTLDDISQQLLDLYETTRPAGAPAHPLAEQEGKSADVTATKAGVPALPAGEAAASEKQPSFHSTGTHVQAANGHSHPAPSPVLTHRPKPEVPTALQVGPVKVEGPPVVQQPGPNGAAGRAAAPTNPAAANWSLAAAQRQDGQALGAGAGQVDTGPNGDVAGENGRKRKSPAALEEAAEPHAKVAKTEPMH